MNWIEEYERRIVPGLAAARKESVTDTAFWTPGNWCTCELCGRDFKAKRRVSGTKFCSNRCRQKHYRQSKARE